MFEKVLLDLATLEEVRGEKKFLKQLNGMRFYKTLQCCCLFLFYVLFPSVGLFLRKHRRKLLLPSIVAVILREGTRDDILSVGIP